MPRKEVEPYTRSGSIIGSLLKKELKNIRKDDTETRSGEGYFNKECL